MSNTTQALSRIEAILDDSSFVEIGAAVTARATGIGLNLSKLIIEAHHGSVSVNNNEDGRGVSFRIIIPKYNMKRKAK